MATCPTSEKACHLFEVLEGQSQRSHGVNNITSKSARQCGQGMGCEVFTNPQGLVPVVLFRYLDTIEMGVEDLIAKDSLNKRDTEDQVICSHCGNYIHDPDWDFRWARKNG
jgi:hypothetical protein